MKEYNDFIEEIKKQESAEREEAISEVEALFKDHIISIDDIGRQIAVDSIIYGKISRYKKEVDCYVNAFGWSINLTTSKTSISDPHSIINKTTHIITFNKA